jgi:hypothetical protein
VHVNDAALDKKGAFHTWALPGVQGAFSIFRIWQTGFNSNSHHYLALSGFEIYGDLFDLPQQQGVVVQQQAFQQQQFAQNNAGLPSPYPSQPISNYLPNSGPSQPFLPAPSCGLPFNPADPALISFRYAFDFDQNGLFYYLGSNGRRNQWQNPGELGIVACSASSLAVNPPSMPASAIVGRETVRCVTVPKPDQFFIIDMRDKLFCPSHYTLRHYNSWDSEALRFWRLEGSLDGHSWDVLKNHQNDQALKKKGETHTWAINAAPRLYRLFRIYQTGPNSNNNNYLALSGVEMYGFLALKPPSSSAVQPQPQPQLQQQQQPQQQTPPYHNNMQGLHPPAYPGYAAPAQLAPPSYNQSVVAPQPPNRPSLSQYKPPVVAQQPYMVPSVVHQQPNLAQFGGKKPVEFKEGMEFNYKTDFDDNGILYWLGTNQYQQPWRNPAETGLVLVQSVPLAEQPKSEPCSAIVGRSVVRCVTLPNREGWFMIDFQRWWIKPTHYSLRHYDSWDTECLRDWKLQASNDGKKWTKLMSHKKDETLNCKGASGTWVIPKPKKGYRMFRILQTGKNSNGHWYMACSGFEIYGQIYSYKC